MADKSSREIERELEQERAELRNTIDEVFNRMTLEGAWDRAGMYMRQNRGEFGQTLGRVIKEKPIAVGLVAIGMAWIVFGSSTAARRPSREESFRGGDARGNAGTRARLATGDFDDTSAQGPTGSDARTDPWAAPMRTPASATSAPGTPDTSASRGTGTGALEGAASPDRSAPAASGGAGRSSAESLGGAKDTHGSGSTAGPKKAASEAPLPGPSSSNEGTSSTGSTSDSGTRSPSAINTASGPVPTDAESAKK